MNKDTLNTYNYFSTPIYTIDKPEWVNKIDKACDKYIKESYKRDKKGKKDFGHSYHSTTMLGDKNFTELQDYIGATTHNLLNEWGCDVEQYKIYFTEFWVQEFSKRGGGNHDTHTHWDNHMSGFYFLKCSEKTSYPVFHDPRPGKKMTDLMPKEPNKVNYCNSQLHYKVKPGKFIFFNLSFKSFLPFLIYLSVNLIVSFKNMGASATHTGV